ncbi:MAG TPA: Rieske (2Fe-2S) protein [Bacteroidota bacterium]|jgi:Rieske Fe-S protein|nr:Rieske (2Fe-2S) protein [Bacteroidota bacterium]
MQTTTDAPSPNESKRSFLKFILAGGLTALAASIFYPILAYMKPPKQGEVEISSVKAGKLSDIPKDSGTIVKFGTKPVILVRNANGDLRALSATCTHLDCTVQYKKELGLIWCACHNGKYDLNGRNVSGPPPRPLEEYRVVVQGEEVLISKNA